MPNLDRELAEERFGVRITLGFRERRDVRQRETLDLDGIEDVVGARQDRPVTMPGTCCQGRL